jgi:CRP-like cAMP-binding protein
LVHIVEVCEDFDDSLGSMVCRGHPSKLSNWIYSSRHNHNEPKKDSQVSLKPQNATLPQRIVFLTHCLTIHLRIRRNRHYLTTWFIIDFFGTFPFEHFVSGESASSRKSLKLIKYFKIPKLLRISRLMKYIRDHKCVYDIFQVFVLVFTFLHVGACVWMMILSPCIESDGIFDYSELCSQENVSNLYCESFHLSATMMLGVSNSHIIGDSSTLDMLTEKRQSDRGLMYTVSTLFMVGGLFLVALLISELNVFVFGKSQGSAAFQRKIDRVRHEMEYYSVPDDLQVKVKAFYDYVWIHQKQYDDRIALLSDDQMSTDLQRKLALHLYKDVVSHISIFSEIDDLLLGEICLSLRTRIFLPGDMIIFKGDVGKELFIIAKGVVEVLRDDLPPSQRKKSPPILLKNGSFFGEIALIMETRRTCSVQARTVCEVNILEQKTFDTIIRENPDFARKMNELVVARQLETSMSKTANDGVDFQVSKDDMDAALNVVEKNMKQGLNRRMRGTSLSLSTETFQENSERQPSILSIAENNNAQPGMKDEETDEVNQTIEDIARRSTRFVKRAGPRQRSATLPTHEKKTNRLRTYSSDAKRGSSTEVVQLSSNPLHVLSKNDALACPFSIVDGDGEDAETMLVTGHYNPNRFKVDRNKVRPSILFSGENSNTVSRLEIQLRRQEVMIARLIDTVETFASGNDNCKCDNNSLIGEHF